MATKIAPPAAEKIYECEVKRRRVRAAGGYEPFWKTKTLLEALVDGDTEFRCKDCHGAVKLHKRNLPTGPIAHVAHKLRNDSEYCASGAWFLGATDGRAPRLSGTPVA